MHIQGAQPKGKKETRPSVAFEIPTENLSGLNSDALSPHSSWSWWTRIVGKQSITPAGNDKLPSFFLFCCEHFKQA